MTVPIKEDSFARLGVHEEVTILIQVPIIGTGSMRQGQLLQHALEIYFVIVYILGRVVYELLLVVLQCHHIHRLGGSQVQ